MKGLIKRLSQLQEMTRNKRKVWENMMERKDRMYSWLRRAAAVFVVVMGTGMLLWGPVTAMAKVKAKGPGGIDVYDYPGFKGAGPGEYMVSSWNYESDESWGPAYRGGPYDRGWRYTPDGWWYRFDNGSWPADEWACIDGRWYYFNEGGHLKTGWLDKDGYRYYLNPVDDGSLGDMRVGWQIIGGKAYYFNGSSDGTYGALLTNTTTPDGYRVGADGAMVR